jgi:hypothetical protein
MAKTGKENVAILPPAEEVRVRLSRAVREAEILRRQLRLSERAERQFPEHFRQPRPNPKGRQREENTP